MISGSQTLHLSLRQHYPDQVQRVGALRPLSLSAPRLLYCSKCNLDASYTQPPAMETINSPSTVVAAVISPA
jgi:hypothetical protein